MKKLIVLVLIVLGGHQLWQKYENRAQPDYDTPYVTVYGRDSCGFTQRMLSDLRSKGINYHYFIVDDQKVAERLHQKMEKAGISTRRYNLPVVDVNGALSVRPDFEDVARAYAGG